MQVLLTEPVMSPADIIVIACWPAVAEEVLFRGGLVGLLGWTMPAVVVSGVVFGVLHATGGRNYASAAFATSVGILYGTVYLQTGSLSAAMLAHCVGNASSAAAWLHARESR